ncbi:GWxTD domain-containing protein [bacterium]|nr:GWxTD domain-containing protein [bacterium]
MQMFKRIPYFLLGWLICISVPLSGQIIRGGEIQFDADIARFKANNDLTYLELYISVPRDGVSHQLEGDQHIANFEMGVNIFYGDSLLSQSSKQMVDRVNSLDEIDSQQLLYNIFVFSFQKGDFKIRTRVTDQNKNVGGWHEQSVSISSFPDSSLGMSDIQISTLIVSDQANHPLVKNGYRIIPYPSKLYGLELPILYFYSEIYHLSPIVAGEDSNYSMVLSVLDANGNIVKENAPVVKKRTTTSAVYVGQIQVSDLYSGVYNLKLDVTDTGTGKSVSRTKSFSVYRPVDFASRSETEVVSQQRIDNMYVAMDEAELDRQFEYCQYIVTGDDKKVYKELDLDGKREFMTEFWRRRNNNPMLTAVQYRDEYLRRVYYSNAHYSHGAREGWKSDLGRVYIKYGEPDYVDRYPYSPGMHAFEVWQYYEIEGGIEFYFVDDVGMGEMRLVHSTAIGEVQDYDWQRHLDPTGLSDINDDY